MSAACRPFGIIFIQLFVNQDYSQVSQKPQVSCKVSFNAEKLKLAEGYLGLLFITTPRIFFNNFRALLKVKNPGNIYIN